MNERDLIETLDRAVTNYAGNSNTLESAIGALVFGRHVGWKPLFLIHQRSTIKRYENILGIKFRDVLPDVGPQAHRSYAWKAASALSSFWKAVKGEIPNVKTPEISLR